MAMRVILFGALSGPGLFEMMEILGKQECLRRIEEFLKCS